MSVKSFKTSGVGVDLAPQGLVLINTTSFSAVASQSINDVFNATYDNYRIIVKITSASNDQAELRFRARVSASDNSSNNYVVGNLYVGVTDNNVASNTNNATISFFGLGNYDSVVGSGHSVDLYNPFATQNTQLTANATGSILLALGGSMTVTTSYTGFTLLASAGTITGNVSVYGYNK